MAKIRDENMDHEFIYKTQTYQYNFRYSIQISDYIFERLDYFLHNLKTPLIDNEECTDFTVDSIKNFTSYLSFPNFHINIDNDNVFTYKKLSEKYKIRSLQEETKHYIDQHNKELIIRKIKDQNLLSLEDEKNIVHNLIEFIDNKELLLLSISFIDRILQNYRNENQNEDLEKETKIMNFFFEYLKKHGKIASVLFKYINFSLLRKVFIEKILIYRHLFDFQFVSSDIIQILCESYVKFSPLEFQPKEGREFDGIMKYLTDHNEKINISTNSIYKDIEEYQPSLVINYYRHKKYYYHSNNDKHFSICFDFINNSVQLEKYSIQSSNYPVDDERHLKTFVVEVSNYKVSWTIVDEHEVKEQEICKPNGSHVFTNKVQKNEFYRYIQIRQTGEKPLYTILVLVEFFGKLRSNSF